jgi:DNA-binding NtrC family response regulator
VERILVVDDQPEVCALVEERLSDEEHRVTSVPDAERALATLAAHPGEFGLVILDLDFGPGRITGIEFLERLRADDPDLPVIVLTGKGTIPATVQCMRLGALDVLEKDTYLEEHLSASVGKASALRRVIAENRALRDQCRTLRQEADYYRQRLERNYRIVGHSRPMRAVLEQVKRVGPLPRPALVRGERGTGKELVAHAIHQAGPRAHGPFVTVNCAALPEGLLETEMFGQEANAFHNAPFKLGRFDLANRGTLFLDEIGNMSREFQQKILRVIEYQTFERVGGTQAVTVDVRIVAASNANLEQAMAEGRFREDLYDRLAFETIPLPPLRERREDIEPLAYFFIERFAEEVAGIGPKQISADALERLRGYDYPGNVRELKNVIERAMTYAPGRVIGVEHLPAEVAGAGAPRAGAPLAERLAEFEREQVRSALEAADWDRGRAAAALGLSAEAVGRLCRKYHLRRE